MSTVTLETLRADFEAANRRAGEFFVNEKANRNAHRLRDYVREVGLAVIQAKQARDIWEVGEKYGLNAAMLFKLSDGAIDPRVKA